MSSSTASSAGGIAASTGGGAAAGSAAGPIGAGIGAVLGAGIGIYGAIESAQAQAAIDTQEQQLEEAQAAQVGLREQENDAISQSSGYKRELDFSSESAASGHEGGGIGSQLEIQRQTNLQQYLNDQAASFQQSQILAGAGMKGQLASQTSTAGYISAAGQGARLLGNALSPNSGIVNYSPTAQSLPNPGAAMTYMGPP